MSKKGSVLAEVTKDKHDELSCLFVKDMKIIGSGDIPLESGGINMKERIARVSSIWLFSFFNISPLLVIDSTRFNHPMICGRVGSWQLR